MVHVRDRQPDRVPLLLAHHLYSVFTFATLQHPQLSIVRANRFRHVPALVGGVSLKPANGQRSSGGEGGTSNPYCGGCSPRDKHAVLLPK